MENFPARNTYRAKLASRLSLSPGAGVEIWESLPHGHSIPGEGTASLPVPMTSGVTACTLHSEIARMEVK